MTTETTRIVSLVLCAICINAARADFSSDTLAFYPFADKPAGETAETGDIITNAVAAGIHNGTVKLVKKTTATGYGSLTFERFPLPYVYSDWACTNLLTSEAQSIHVKSNGLDRNGAAVLINSIAETLYDERETTDYTIELFWRFNFTGEYRTGFFYSCQSDHNIYICYGNSRDTVRLNFSTTQLNYGTQLSDGLWHHIALVYDHETKLISIIGDYDRVTKYSFNEASGAATARYFILGSNQTSATTDVSTSMTEDIELACLRVTKRKLAPKDFMVAYGAPMQNGNTVFHWGFDGTDGTDIGVVADRSRYGANWDAMTTQYFYAGKSKCLRDGELSKSGTSCSNAVYRVESNRSKSVLSAGETVVDGANLCAGELLATATPSSGLAQGYGFQWSTNSFLPVTGSFTIESLTQLNQENWQHKVIDVNVDISLNRWRTTLMCRSLPYAASGDWKDTWGVGAFCLRADPGSDGLTTFLLSYTYYDGNHLPRTANATPVDPQTGTTWKMTNAEFGRTYHHFAVTYDPDSLKLALYIDYELRISVNLPGPLTLDASPNWLFGVGCNNCAFDGRYDEIRLSRGVLDPSEFLRMTRPASGFLIYLR